MKQVINHIPFVVVVLATFSFTSCRFSKPIFSKLVSVDSIKTDQRQVVWNYEYYRFARSGTWGSYQVINTYDEKGAVASIQYKRKSSVHIEADGNGCSKEKTLEFSNGVLRKKLLYVFKSKGIGGKCRLNKEYYYAEDGKFIRSVNRKKR